MSYTGNGTNSDEPRFDEVHDEVQATASPFGQLRQQHQKLGEKRPPLDLEIPGYNGVLVARYKMIPWEVAKEIGEKTQKSKNPRKELLAQCSLIVHANEVLLIRDEGVLKRFQDMGDSPASELPEEVEVTWASKEFDLCMAFDPVCNTSRERVLRTFRNDLAVAAHHQEITEWLQSNRTDDEEGFTESS